MQLIFLKLNSNLENLAFHIDIMSTISFTKHGA